MGAGESKQSDPGIVTVSIRASSAGGGPPRASGASGSDPLLAHLRALRALVPDIEGRVSRADPSSIWRDIESACELGGDTQELAAALGELLGAYRAWHSEVRPPHAAACAACKHMRTRVLECGAMRMLALACCTLHAVLNAGCTSPCACGWTISGLRRIPCANTRTNRPPPPPQRARTACANQDYINRCIDQAEARAARALRSVHQQLQRLRALNAALKDAAALPGLLAEVQQATAELQARCEALSAALPAAAGSASKPGGGGGGGSAKA